MKVRILALGVALAALANAPSYAAVKPAVMADEPDALAARLSDEITVASRALSAVFAYDYDASQPQVSSVSQIWSNNKESREGTYAALIDGSTSNGEMFHSSYTGTRAALKDSYDNLCFARDGGFPDKVVFTFTTRAQTNAELSPTIMDIYVSNDTAAGWTKVATVYNTTAVNLGRTETYTSPEITTSGAKYFRMDVLQTVSSAEGLQLNNYGHPFFALTEMNLYPSKGLSSTALYNNAEVREKADALIALIADARQKAEAGTAAQADIDALAAGVAALEDSYSDFEDGAIYRIVNVAYTRAMYETWAGGTVGTEAPGDDIAQYWRISKSGSGYSLQNMCTRRYIQRQGGTFSVQYKTGSAQSAFTVSRNTSYADNIFNIIDNTGNGVGLHSAESQSYNVVGWYVNGADSAIDASAWRLQKVVVSDDSLEQAYRDFTEHQRIVRSAGTIRSRLNSAFTDISCTELRAAFRELSDQQLRDTLSALPEVLREMAVKVKNDGWQKWEREFRVARYGIYSRPEYWANRLNMNAYSRQNNPTGILAGKNEILYVMVGSRIPSGASLSIETCSTTGVQATYSQTLSRGLNIFVAPEDNSQVYISYISADGSEIAGYDSLNIHIEGGRVNGYFSTVRHDDADWAEMWDDGLFTGPVIDVKGKYVLMHMNSKLFHQNVGSQVSRVMDMWDYLAHEELDLTGILKNDELPDVYEDLYPRRFNNLMECVSVDHDYMFATWYYTAYVESSLSVVLNYDKLAAGGGEVWGPTHEMGHCNQGAINVVGGTEVSNNIFSNAILHKMGKSLSRGYNVQDAQPMLARRLSWPERVADGNTSCLMRMYFSLYLYYHVLGHDTTFYQRLFHELRNDPMRHPASPSVVSGNNDYLKFARIASKVAGEDLTDFFEYWGFFRPVSNFTFTDYSTYTVTTTQADIDATKEYIRSCGKPNPQVIFIEDRVRRVREADGTYRRSYSETFANGSTYSEPIESCKSQMGQYQDYPLNLEPSGFIYTVTAAGQVTVPRTARNAVGMIVYDKDGRLAYVADTYTFTLPSYLVSEGGYSIYSVRSNGELVRMYNRTVDKYYTVNVYRKGVRAVVRYTDGIAGSGTIPSLEANDIALLRDNDAPEALKSLTNFIAADSTAASVELTDSVGYYAPFEFTAAKLSFTATLPAKVSNMALPFAVDAGAFSSVGSLMVAKGTETDGESAYVLYGDTAGIIEATYPLLIVRNDGDGAAQWSYSGENVRLCGGGRQHEIGGAGFVANFLDTERNGTVYISSADCSSFDKHTDRNRLQPFTVWLSAADDSYERYLLKGTGTVGIDKVDARRDRTGGRIYTIDGVRVTNPQKGGIYVIDGRKRVY